MTSQDQYRQIALQAVKLAEDRLKERGELQVAAKGDRDYVSNIDIEIEQLVRQYLAEVSPEVAFVGEEEGGQNDDAKPWWCLDPIDGTVNFIHGSPLFAISLALIENGRPTVGVVSLPAMAVTYDASTGTGARRNGYPIQLSGSNLDLSAAVVAIGDYAVGEDSTNENRVRIAITERLANTVLRVRMHGSAAIDLVWLADGKIDAAIIVAANPWDVAAGVIIAQEAGAEITDLDGHEYTARRSGLLGAPPSIHPSLDATLFPPRYGSGVTQLRERLVVIDDQLRATADDDFTSKHRLNLEADALRRQLRELMNSSEARETMENWADRSGRKNAHETDYDLEAAKARMDKSSEGGGSA